MSAVILTFILHTGLVIFGYWLGLLKGKKDLEAFIQSFPEVEEAYIYAVTKETDNKKDSEEKKILVEIEKLKTELNALQSVKEATPANEEKEEEEVAKKQFKEKEFKKF